jgi:hypothetical protein
MIAKLYYERVTFVVYYLGRFRFGMFGGTVGGEKNKKVILKIWVYV